MNTVKIVYLPRLGTENKTVVLGSVVRFAESYTAKAKDLSVQLECIDEYPIDDAVLAELISATVVSIALMFEQEDGAVEELATLTDYTKTRDIRKDYNLKTSIITVNCIFQDMLMEEDTSATDSESNEATPA